jgi:hypothetical protein
MTSQSAVLALLLAIPAFSARAQAEDLTFKIPPVKTAIDIAGQPIAITSWGTISSALRDPGRFRLALAADLSDLQANVTGLLRAQLDRSDRCGEHIAIQQADIVPAEPASVLTVHLHFERWACAKAFGNQIVKKLVAGNAVVPVRLTPAVEDGVSVRLVPEIGAIQADGSLGEMLNSGSFGETIREKITAALLHAIQKGTALDATLPPALRGLASIRDVRFADGGAGRLRLLFAGEVRVSSQQMQVLLAQLKDRAGR